MISREGRGRLGGGWHIRRADGISCTHSHASGTTNGQISTGLPGDSRDSRRWNLELQQSAGGTQWNEQHLCWERSGAVRGESLNYRLS